MITVTGLLTLLGVYLACGFTFSIPFALVGVKRIDPHAISGSWGVRILIIPGTMLLWPLLARRWVSGATHPPKERNAHRCITGAPVSEPSGLADNTCQVGDRRSAAGQRVVSL